jgi:hypothetical protein
VRLFWDGGSIYVKNFVVCYCTGSFLKKSEQRGKCQSQTKELKQEDEHKTNLTLARPKQSIRCLPFPFMCHVREKSVALLFPLAAATAQGLKTAPVAVFKTDESPIYRGFRAAYRGGRFSRFGFIKKPVGYPYRAAAVRSVTVVTDRFTSKL